MELQRPDRRGGGQGAFSVELELTETLTKLNYHFFATKHYMSRIRGGHNFHMVRIADRPVHALKGGKLDMVVALDDETEALHKLDLREGGSFLSRAMTPATSILHYFSEAAQDLPVHFEQAEDEIAAINMAMGASYAGVRSMAATSGGGFAFMQEGVSLAGMTETPIVVAVAQRPGPATGFPTRTEQGEIPLDVIACEYPVFDATYKRYRLTEDGISPLTFPGLSDALVKLDSDEHDEEGKITEDPDLRKRMMDKRLKKMVLLKQEAVLPTFCGAMDAAAVVLCWGSNRLIVKEAAERLNDDGLSFCVLHFGQVYPLTPAMIAPYRLETKKRICVENNATGQFAGLLKRELGIVVDHNVLKYDGDCFTVEELYQTLKGLIS